jgi:antitoxin MazE
VSPPRVDRSDLDIYIVDTRSETMVKKLVQHGNSAALIIDKPILQLLAMDIGTPVEISTDGRSLTISPVRDEKTAAQFRAAIEKVNTKHGKTFRSLAR